MMGLNISENKAFLEQPSNTSLLQSTFYEFSVTLSDSRFADNSWGSNLDFSRRLRLLRRIMTVFKMQLFTNLIETIK
jgi:hypothetical protein